MTAIPIYRNYIARYRKPIAVFYVVFYLVGIVGLMMPLSFPFFVTLIPFALLLSFAGLFFFHAAKVDKKTAIVFSGIYLTGFFTEAIGVNTGLVFGQYYYGHSLGIKFLGTPLLIGINWLLLVYLTSNIAGKVIAGAIPQIFVASSLMLVYDLILEQVAPALDMWHWVNGVPLQNYTAWFVMSIIFHSVLKIYNISATNKLAPAILCCQLIFFSALFTYFQIRP